MQKTLKLEGISIGSKKNFHWLFVKVCGSEVITTNLASLKYAFNRG
jgi:hypothetical protein